MAKKKSGMAKVLPFAPASVSSGDASGQESAPASIGTGVIHQTRQIQAATLRDIFGFDPRKPSTPPPVSVTVAEEEPPPLTKEERVVRDAAAKQKSLGLMAKVRAFGADLDSALTGELNPEHLRHA